MQNKTHLTGGKKYGNWGLDTLYLAMSYGLLVNTPVYSFSQRVLSPFPVL